jgi:hypothetical protein
MAVMPHDITDLHLAPIVLAVDGRIEELGRLDPDGLSFRIALEGDRSGLTAELREAGLLQAVSQRIDIYEWELSIDPRGLKLTHGRNSLVLGIPDTFRRYLAGR